MKTCHVCHVGNLQRKYVTYSNWHAGQFVTVPHLAAWSCDACAYCEIDSEAIQRLMPLLGPVTRPDPALPWRARQQAAREPSPEERDLERRPT